MSDAVDLGLQRWPEEGLERLGRCPVCGTVTRSLMFDDLTDRVWRQAPGRWTLWRCRGCGVAYLDPRPSEAANELAYGSYYTHAALAAQNDGLAHRRASARGRLEQGVRNGHLNKEFGHLLPFAFPGAATLARLTPRKAARAAHFIRHLPAPAAGGRLLDVGCGNGAFLRVAATLGYEACGLEPDRRSAVEARRAGFSVANASVPGSGLTGQSYSHVTLSHVFEHLHRPVEALKEIFRLLAPGGRLWIAVPNLAATGLALFGPDWVGLDPPRHLVLHDEPAMRRLLERCGFVDIDVLPAAPDADFYCRSSLLVRAGLDILTTAPFPEWNWAWRRRAAEFDRAGARAPKIGESLTVIAYRPRKP